MELDPGTRRAADRGGRDDPARADRAQRPARPDPRLARRRHARLPAAAAPGRAARASAGAARSSRPACAASSRSGATSPRSTGCSRSGARNIARSITSFRQLSEALGRSDTRLAEWVTAQNQALRAFANQRRRCSETPAGVPVDAAGDPAGACSRAPSSRSVLGPASAALIPAAQAFAPAQVALAGASSNETVEPIRDQIRPFSRQVQRPVKHLKQASQPLAQTAKLDRRRVQRAQPALQRLRLQPARLRGGLPVLDRVAEPQHQRLRPAPGRRTGRCRAASSCSPAGPPGSPRASRSRARSSARCSSTPTSPQSKIICPLDPSDTGAISFTRPNADGSDGGDRPPTISPDPDRGRLRDLVLRPRALPLARLRRRDPAEAGGLPVHGPVRRGDPARARSRTCGSPGSRSAR